MDTPKKDEVYSSKDSVPPESVGQPEKVDGLDDNHVTGKHVLNVSTYLGEPKTGSSIKDYGRKSSGEDRERGVILQGHYVGLACAEHYLPQTATNLIRDDLERIDRITNEETIESRRDAGLLPPSFKGVEYALAARGVNPNLLTEKEAKELADYASNATQSAIEEKFRVIYDALANVRNGAKSRRERFDPKLDELITLAKKYEDGKYNDDTNHFDLRLYLLDRYGKRDLGEERDYSTSRRIAEEEGYDDNYSNAAYSRFFRDTDVQSELEVAILEDDLSVDELIEQGFIEDSDIPVIGPFTSDDLDGIAIFKKSTWVTATNHREQASVNALLSNGVVVGSSILEDDLLQAYVADHFLKDRRPKPRQALQLIAALGLEFNKIPKDEIVVAKSEDFYKDLKDTLSRASYYLVILLGMRKEEVEAEYRASRPTSKEFFSEVMERANGLTEQQVRSLVKDHGSSLTKLESWTFEFESLFAPFVKSDPNKTPPSSDEDRVSLLDNSFFDNSRPESEHPEEYQTQSMN